MVKHNHPSTLLSTQQSRFHYWTSMCVITCHVLTRIDWMVSAYMKTSLKLKTLFCNKTHLLKLNLNQPLNKSSFQIHASNVKNTITHEVTTCNNISETFSFKAKNSSGYKIYPKLQNKTYPLLSIHSCIYL